MYHNAHNCFEVIFMAKCCICGDEKKDNLMILGVHICADCEWKILTANAHRAGYRRCAEKLKRLFPQQEL